MLFFNKKFWACSLLFFSLYTSAQNKSNLDYVDPTIGGVGVILQPTRPTVHLPNSMVRVFPNREDHLDDQISNFQLTITSHRLFKVFAFMPVSGGVNPVIWNQSFENGPEVLQPYYYKTTFEDAGNSIEFTPQERSGIFKVQFTDTQDHYLRMGTYNGKGEIATKGKRIITGTEVFATELNAPMKAYFYAEIDTDITDIKYKTEGDKNHVLIGIGNCQKEVAFKYGVSYISIKQAKQNLKKEISDFDFEKVKTNAFNVWDKAFSQINVKGGTLAQKRVFYTSFYRSYERMVNINEYGKYYSNFDKSIHKSKEPFYVDNWIWDNYIALEPLHMILNPVMATDRIKSYIKMYEQGGTMPSFGLIFGDWPAMTGNFAAVWMLDAWTKGLRDFDLEKAYEGGRKNALDATLIPWANGPKTELDDFYNENGYFPSLHPGEEETVKEVSMPWERRQAVSVTIENSYSDWSLAQIAAELNKKDDTNLFLDRAGNYKNVFRVDKGFMWAKDKNGAWVEDYDPRFADRMYFTENNAYTYNWSPKHDLSGLFELMGGTKGAEATLDQLFREPLGTSKWKFWAEQPDSSGLVGQFVMGNEPSFHIPYIYNYLGAPWKTQKRMRMLLDTFFTDNLFGIPGDEDGGGMSSYVMFSMMGFFQVTPGVPVYTIASPVFEESTIELPNGKQFTVIAEGSSKENKYIQSATLNGEELNKPWFSHTDLIGGGTLKLIMGAQPNKQWGSDLKDAPPSAIEYTPLLK